MPPLTVKMVKRNPPLYKSFDDSWHVVHKALEKIFSDNTSEVSFERLYRVIYDMVFLGESEKFYKQMTAYLSNKLSSLSDDAFGMVEISTDDDSSARFIHDFTEFWIAHNTHFKLIGDLMLYFDKVYSVPKRKFQVIDLCYSIFANTVLVPLKKSILDAFINTFNKMRNELIDSEDHNPVLEKYASTIDELKSLITMMELILVDDGKVSFFKENFELHFIDRAKTFYSTSIHWDSLSPLEVFYTIELLLPAERDISAKCFSDDTCSKLLHTIEDVLINGKAIAIIDSLVEIAMSKQDSDLLENIMHLSVNNSEYTSCAYDAIKLYVFNDLQTTIHINESLKRRSLMGVQWVSELVGRKEYYETFLDIQYPNERDASSIIIEESFVKFLEVNLKQSIEFLCYYMDSRLKMTPSDLTTFETIRKELMPILKLSKSLSEIDQFMETYRLMLSKRLLHQRYTYEWEAGVLNTLSHEVGSYLTVNIETMLKDVNISGDLARSMKAMTGKNITDSTLSHFDFHPSVLTMTAWPFESMNQQEEAQTKLPNVMQKQLDEFESIYKKRYSQRILKWCHSLGLVEVSYLFGDSENERKYNLVLPFHSAIVFILFVLDNEENEDDKLVWTLDKIQRATGLPAIEVTRQLVSLAIAPRFRILKKTPAGPTIEPADTFSINEDFKSPTETVKVKTVNINPGSMINGGNALIQKSLEKDRFVVVNAAVARIMKQNKTLTEKELFEQCQTVLKARFALQNRTFQRSLHHLIDKEYLATDPDDPGVYRYL
ncbi:cullin-3 [Monosporozyma servazzii]